MQSYAYLLTLLVSLSGLTVLDKRFRAVFFGPAQRFFGLIHLTSLSYFLLWDAQGITLNIFQTNPDWVSGWFLARQLPVEEILFLNLLSYTTLLAWRLPKCLRTS